MRRDPWVETKILQSNTTTPSYPALCPLNEQHLRSFHLQLAVTIKTRKYVPPHRDAGRWELFSQEKTTSRTKGQVVPDNEQAWRTATSPVVIASLANRLSSMVESTFGPVLIPCLYHNKKRLEYQTYRAAKSSDDLFFLARASDTAFSAPRYSSYVRSCNHETQQRKHTIKSRSH